MSKRSFPNWYKLAEAALNITPKEFQAMTYEEKKALAKNKSITQETQLLFFTQEYDYKYNILWPLADNTSISPQTQLLFFTVKYKDNLNTLWALAHNRSISPQTKLLFFTQEYGDKHDVLKLILRNRNIFLKGLTPKELREFAKAKEARLPVYRKRFKDIREKIK